MIHASTTAKQIGQHELFRGFPQEVIELVVAQSEVRHLEEGEILIHPGTTNDCLFLVLDGELPWTASERLWEYQRKRVGDEGRTTRSSNWTVDQVRSEFKRRRRKTATLRSGLDSESLSFMGFSDFPTAGDLRRRYRELAKKWHPDLHAGNEEDFKKLNRAYRHLNAKIGSTGGRENETSSR